MKDFLEAVKRLIEAGADPNDLQESFEDSIEETGDWDLFGDGRWRPATVCSKCGSWAAGICSDDATLDIIRDHAHPAFHKNQPGVQVIPRKEYIKRRGIKLGIDREPSMIEEGRL